MDKRRERTRTAVIAAFGELLGEKPYAKISVQDVLDRAHVGRATFYAHFKDKNDLLEAMAYDICEHALHATAPEAHHDFAGRRDPEAMVEHFLCHLQEREGGVRALVCSDAFGLFADALRHELYAHINEFLPAELEGPAGELNRSFLVHHLASSLVGAVHWWVHHDFSPTPDELAASYLACVSPLFEKQDNKPGLLSGINN